MKKSLIALSAIAALSTSSFAAKVTHADMMKQIEALKAQIEMLEKQIGNANETANTNKVSLEKMMGGETTTVTDARFKKLEKKVDKINKKATVAKAQSAGDNIKWNVDFRTQYDYVSYKRTNASTVKNTSLLTNRLWLNMKYAADENSAFYGTLAYNKVFGDNTATDTNQDGTANNSNFDWVTNEAATNDNEIKLKEAYWLYKNDSFFGNEDIAWTASVGRRPSTDGLGINLRVDQQRKSALSHTVNVEFDGASMRFDLDKITGVEGMWIKFCAGRGLTNAKLRFSSDGQDYVKDEDTTSNVDMAGFILVPWDNGQYSVHMNYAKAWNLIGMKNRDGDPTRPDTGKFEQFGDMQFFTTMFKADGLGDGINDFLDDTIFFASYAMSKTDPNSNEMMLGSSDSETGHSYWIGLNMPDGFSDGRFGLEWNKGSKYWRSMTYGEDTMIGSKIAARGTAWEAYYNKPLTKALSSSIRFTHIDYDYTGSNSFFGDTGTPMDINQATGQVKEATNIAGYIKYRF